MVECDKLLRRVHASRQSGAQRIDPVGNACIKLGVHPHRVVNTTAGFHDAWKDFVDIIDRKRIVGTVILSGTVLARPRPVPLLFRRVTVATEQQELAIGPARYKHGDRLGLGKPGQVIKVAVLTVAILDVTTTRSDRCSRQYGDATGTDHPHQLPAPACEFFTVHFFR